MVVAGIITFRGIKRMQGWGGGGDMKKCFDLLVCGYIEAKHSKAKRPADPEGLDRAKCARTYSTLVIYI